jgi:hypothetical protein
MHRSSWKEPSVDMHVYDLQTNLLHSQHTVALFARARTLLKNFLCVLRNLILNYTIDTSTRVIFLHYKSKQIDSEFIENLAIKKRTYCAKVEALEVLRKRNRF